MACNVRDRRHARQAFASTPFVPILCHRLALSCFLLDILENGKRIQNLIYSPSGWSIMQRRPQGTKKKVAQDIKFKNNMVSNVDVSHIMRWSSWTLETKGNKMKIFRNSPTEGREGEGASRSNVDRCTHPAAYIFYCHAWVPPHVSRFGSSCCFTFLFLFLRVFDLNVSRS